MGWMQKLYETYEKCYDKSNDGNCQLLPISHITQQANIEVTIDERSNILSARVLLDKADMNTIIPCTEDSASRTSSPVPHPLFDKLQYIAGDYIKYGGQDKPFRYTEYIDFLNKWCMSAYSNKKVCTLFQYLSRGSLIKDLVDLKILYCDSNGILMDKWEGDKDKTPAIFKSNVAQIDSFVRFRVVGYDHITKINEDPEVQNSFISFYLSTTDESDLCYITGKTVKCTDKHQKYIRYPGDGAKLISSNDSSGFTFRGRFDNSREALSVSYEVSQKAHNALKWLIEKQGINESGEIFLAWGTNNEQIPSIVSDTVDMFAIVDDSNVNTESEFSSRLKDAIKSYSLDLTHDSEIIIMVIDAATPGRLSINYYQEILGDDFLKRIEYWHKTCYWLHTYKKRGAVAKSFVGAPSLRDIVTTAYGSNVNDKLAKQTLERLLPCVLRKASIPVDIMLSALHRVSNPMAMEWWEWEKALSIACALFNKYSEKERYSMALDERITNRDYLYGRLLAVADQIENLSYDKWGERQTNAKRYMQAFSQKPFKTWTLISQNLVPYQAKLGPKANWYNDLMSYIHSKFNFEDFQNDTPLSGLYLLGYHSQRQVFLDSLKAKDIKPEDTENTENNI